MQDMQVWSLGPEGPPEEEMVTHLSILDWEIQARFPMDRGAW